VKAQPTQAETIADIAARCEGRNRFDNFDRAFRHSLTVSKEAVLKEEARQKRLRAILNIHCAQAGASGR